MRSAFVAEECILSAGELLELSLARGVETVKESHLDQPPETASHLFEVERVCAW